MITDAGGLRNLLYLQDFFPPGPLQLNEHRSFSLSKSSSLALFERKEQDKCPKLTSKASSLLRHHLSKSGQAIDNQAPDFQLKSVPSSLFFFKVQRP